MPLFFSQDSVELLNMVLPVDTLAHSFCKCYTLKIVGSFEKDFFLVANRKKVFMIKLVISFLKENYTLATCLRIQLHYWC